MGRTVTELELSLSASEWLDWQRFYAQEPYGAPLQDVIQAQLRALLANINRNEKARPDTFDVEEFLIFVEPASLALEDPEPELINGLTPADWRLALYMRALGEQAPPQTPQE